MKYTIVYNPNEHKLLASSYSQTYRDMFLMLVAELQPQHITEDCSADDIEGDVVIFYDPHSSYHINIEGIEKHNSIKYEFMNDPHQPTFHGRYMDGVEFYKLGAKDRCERAKKRNIDYIICPYRFGYHKYLAPYLENAEEKLVWFPPVPFKEQIKVKRLSDRWKKVLANGHTNTLDGFNHYDFRKWAFSQECVSHVPGCVQYPDAPKGKNFIPFVSMFSGALALCSEYTVPKYFEIPLAGTVSFIQENEDSRLLGFKDYVNCIVVNKNNFVSRVKDFLNDVDNYQEVADAGREWVEDNYTAQRFAKFIKQHSIRRQNDGISE